MVGADFPEKIEGLAFGPDLPDGRHLLLVTNDNDFEADNLIISMLLPSIPAICPASRRKLLCPCQAVCSSSDPASWACWDGGV